MAMKVICVVLKGTLVFNQLANFMSHHCALTKTCLKELFAMIYHFVGDSLPLFLKEQDPSNHYGCHVL
jgi:hypothetical protein